MGGTQLDGCGGVAGNGGGLLVGVGRRGMVLGVGEEDVRVVDRRQRPGRLKMSRLSRCRSH